MPHTPVPMLPQPARVTENPITGKPTLTSYLAAYLSQPGSSQSELQPASKLRKRSSDTTQSPTQRPTALPLQSPSQGPGGQEPAPWRARALRPTRSTPDSFPNSGRPQIQMADPLTSHAYGSTTDDLQGCYHTFPGLKSTTKMATKTHPHLPAEDRYQSHESFHSSLLQIGIEPSTAVS